MEQTAYRAYCQQWLSRLSHSEQSIDRVLSLLGSLYRSTSYLDETHLRQVADLPPTLSDGAGGDSELVAYLFEQVRGIGDEVRMVRQHLQNLQGNQPQETKQEEGLK